MELCPVSFPASTASQAQYATLHAVNEFVEIWWHFCAGLTERQQLALAMEESKKAAAALQAKDREAGQPLDSEVNVLLNTWPL